VDVFVKVPPERSTPIHFYNSLFNFVCIAFQNGGTIR
jgi:hypothetical protein